MGHRLHVLAILALAATTAPVLAQQASESAASQTRHTSPYNALSDGDKRIVSAIYEAQLGSPNDSAGGGLLTRDDIAGLRDAKGWSNAYARLFKQGMVSDKTLSLAIGNYNRSVKASRGITVINTASGEQLAFAMDKSEDAQPPPASKTAVKPPAKSLQNKPAPEKPAAIKATARGMADASFTGTW